MFALIYLSFFLLVYRIVVWVALQPLVLRSNNVQQRLLLGRRRLELFVLEVIAQFERYHVFQAPGAQLDLTAILNSLSNPAPAAARPA